MNRKKGANKKSCSGKPSSLLRVKGRNNKVLPKADKTAIKPGRLALEPANDHLADKSAADTAEDRGDCCVPGITEIGIAFVRDEKPEEGSKGRTDTMMLLKANFKTGKIDILSLPRDSRVDIEGNLDKLNHAHAYGGMPLLLLCDRKSVV